MKIAVLGTGMVGQALAARLDELGHDVIVGTRDPEAARTRDESFFAAHPGVGLASFADAALAAEVVLNATNGAASLAVLDAARDGLGGKVLVDVANPLDVSAGMPPTLTVKDTDSLGEQIQRAHPDARVVKSLNTLTAGLMTHPGALGRDSSVFVSGDDAQAKEVVSGLLREFGHTDVIDLGDITTARGTEMWLPLWLRLWGALGTPEFNLHIVR
ncbi:NAD(P)-binding domain-containing protein [Knoellia locipacati]|uniref:Oxidoreductase n=1 Tax=Knoellia locipacati TaxID=882824 RepID=A0A512SYS1_9MICO|nr:NAD(P)-binding domain-containing protein [Knoellia locipacati]GEQ13109.1 oxidoreductase [Knoellia locipacati]